MSLRTVEYLFVILHHRSSSMSAQQRPTALRLIFKPLTGDDARGRGHCRAKRLGDVEDATDAALVSASGERLTVCSAALPAADRAAHRAPAVPVFDALDAVAALLGGRRFYRGWTGNRARGRHRCHAGYRALPRGQGEGVDNLFQTGQQAREGESSPIRKTPSL